MLRLLSCFLVAIVSPALASASAETGRILTNTEHVEGLVVHQESLWVATRGGVEKYSLATLSREEVFTTAHGLASNHVWQIAVKEAGLVARTRDEVCRFDGERFQCDSAERLAMPVPATARRFEGAREIERLALGEQELVATAGNGVWLKSKTGQRRITPLEQICSNHMMAITEWKQQMWFGSFDEGVCVRDGATFRTPDVAFHMVNDLLATPQGLFLATGAGLYRSRDGFSFDRVKVVNQRGVNGLAFDGHSLWATTPGAVFRVRIKKGGPKTKAFWRPAGSRSLQSVAAGSSGVWLASEDKGLIHKTDKGWVAHDRAAGSPSSWTLAVAVADNGVAYGATLRHGVIAVELDGTIRRLKGLENQWGLDVRTVGAEVFVGTQAGAMKVVATGQVNEIEGLPNPNVHAIHVGQKLCHLATESGVLVRDLPAL